MNMMTIEESEKWEKSLGEDLSYEIGQLKMTISKCEEISKSLELLKTQIASARIDGKKEFDADTYMKPKKEKK